MSETQSQGSADGVAIIGMAGRFPRARNVHEFWKNIRDGVECISRFSPEELEIQDAARWAADPGYVPARSTLDNVDGFDAAFFGILPKEAELIDPQHRVFLECCWEALEDAGYDPQASPQAIAVFAGCSANTYFLRNLCRDRAFIEEYTHAYQVGHYPTLLGTNQDFLATRVSYKLNLKGPSFTIQCGCSTSLVAICQACQSLLCYQSDMALAGGVSITFPQRRGYVYQEGGMGSRDGRCRSFDADAQGTVFGSGSAVVLLKRLDEAVADGDHIYAVIKGFALNNDGSAKVGYTAPSVDGQAQVITMAQELADVDPESIGYIEAHGTATPLGDPIEFAALTRAFRTRTQAKGFCALGTVKQNVGHLDIAAGVTGLINATQALVHEQLPPAIRFDAPNPNIDLANSPFYVNTRLSPWKRGPTPRRAGVSSFGVGGTNAHVIVEEAPPAGNSSPPGAGHLLIVSARTATALEQATENLGAHLKADPEIDLGAVAFTLQAGRRPFEYRRALVCTDREAAVRALESRDPRRVATRRHNGREAQVVFLFPGQGSQERGMGQGLYQSDPSFRDEVDRCAELLAPHLGMDLRTALYPDRFPGDTPVPDLAATWLAQPALFVIEYALARLWIRWGVRPAAMLGHSVGELVAACLAGVFSLEDALAIIATRGRLMQQLPGGAMLAVRLGEAEVAPLLDGTLSLAAVNAPAQSLVSGPRPDIELLEAELVRRGVGARRIATSHAFHSDMMDPIIDPFTRYLERFRYHAPSIPFLSGVDGTWITAEQATDPGYWARQLRQPVRFSRGVEQLGPAAETVFLETGPGRTLSGLVRQHRAGITEPVVIASLPDAAQAPSDPLGIAAAAGRLWLHGVSLDWHEMHGRQGRRCSLPTYPFERKRFWVDPPAASPAGDTSTDRITTPPADPAAKPIEEGEELMTAPPAIEAPASGRSARIRTALIEVFEELSGLSLAEFDASATFLEMGFDSLFLTQVTQALQGRFGLKIAFRQLQDQESTLAALAEYLDAKLSLEAFPEPSPRTPDAQPCPSPSAPEVPRLGASVPTLSESERPTSAPGPNRNAAPISSGGSAMEAILREQLQAMSELMSKQLDLLRWGGSPTGTPGSAASAEAQPLTSPAAAPAPGPAPVPSTAGPAAARPSPGRSPAEETDGSTREFKPFGPYKPVQKGTVGDLTERQARYLEALVRRYTTRTARSKEFTQAHRRVLADPRVAAGFRAQWKEMVYPIVTVRSRGSRLWDLDGNEYIDILNGFGPIMLGHAPEFVTEAVRKQMEDGFEIGPQTILAGEVANLVCELTGMERATFCNTGSEAVMAAIRVARTVTGRKKFVLFAGSYHGTFDEVLVRGISKGGVPHSLPIAPGIPIEKVAHVTVLDYGTPEALDYIRASAHELAAVLVEPVQSRHPALQPAEFLREVRRITAESGTALIFDEVVTGFRVHPGGAQAVFGIRADLATYGKVAGGGMPIGILAGQSEFMDALDGGFWQFGDESNPEKGVTFFAGTFVRHPLALAATSAVLHHLKDQGPGLQKALNERTTGFVQALNDFLKERAVPTHIEHFGSIFSFSLPADQRFGSLLYYHLREKGVHILEGFPCFLTTTHSEADLQQVIRAFQESLVEMQEGGVLPEPPGRSMPDREAAARPAPGETQAPSEFPPTEAQVEILLSARISDEASCAYNESFTVTFRGALDEPALRSALQQLVDRHDALRCTFDAGGDCLRVRPRLDLEIPRFDLSAMPPEPRRERLDEIIREDAAQPFDLVRGPLVRTTLFRLEPDHHALLVTAHHLVCDGWSTNVLLDEMSRLYHANTQGLPCALPAPKPFRDYALAQSDWVRSTERARVEAWWLQQYATPVSPLELPVDRPRGSLKSFGGATVRSQITAEKALKIRRFGAQQGCTLFATLLTAFKILLHRLTGQDDIVVGIPTAGQSLLDDEVLVGHCVNFLPLRSSFASDLSVRALMTGVKSTLLDAYEHQAYTYGSLIRKLALPKDPSRLPLVEVQFNLERVGSGLSFPGLEVQVDPNPKCFVNFDLFFNAVESDQGIVIDCDYNTDLLDRDTVARWLHHYETLLDSMIVAPEQPVSTCALLDERERHRLLVEWNQTQRPYPQDRCVHHLFEEQAARAPAALAISFEDRGMTYGELETAANQLAHYLQGLGVGPGSTVGICLDRSPEMIVGLLGVLKAGGAYVPIDPAYPRERIAAMVEDAEPSLLLTQELLVEKLKGMGARPLCLDRARTAILQESSLRPESSVSPRNLAYLIFTSGSTGRPKGVPVSHRSVVNLLTSMAREPGLSAKDALLAVTTLSFDIAVLELFLPLSVGARIVLASREVASDGHRLLELITSSGATTLQATPATWRLLLEAGWDGNPRIKVLCGGEALPRDLANGLLARSDTVWNLYGPTETTVWSAASLVEPGTGPPPIGPPIANTQFYVLDRFRQPVPIGVPGELHIGGDGVAPGYWKQPRLTGEKFIADPFGEEPESRVYKTGDLARYLPSGQLEFLGRLDTQTKVRGFRIETAEVESALLQYPGVRQCVVMAREDTPGDNRLVAYLVVGPPAPPGGELRRFLATRLPDYMVPSAFVPVEDLPRTPNGKLDRRKLPRPELASGPPARDHVEPSSPRERILADICGEVLHLDRVSVQDSLFDLGADSIHLFQIVARANEAGMALTPKHILSGRSISAILAALRSSEAEELARESGDSELVPVSRERYRRRRSSLVGPDALDGRGQSRWDTH